MLRKGRTGEVIPVWFCVQYVLDCIVEAPAKIIPRRQQLHTQVQYCFILVSPALLTKLADPT